MLISNSEVVCFQRCQREWQYRYLERWAPIREPQPLLDGRAVHECLAAHWRGSEVDTAVLSSPQLRALLTAYRAYWGSTLASPVCGIEFDAVKVDVPFVWYSLHTPTAWYLPQSLDVVGVYDAVLYKSVTPVAIVEHKTTSREISPGSEYWRELSTGNSQASTYCLASGLPIIWDALHKTGIQRRAATELAKRKITRMGRLYANQRDSDESDEELFSRAYDSIAESPERYFQRALIVRTDRERSEFVRDLSILYQDIERKRHEPTSRNPEACHAFGRPCDFFSVCWEGSALAEPNFAQRELNHTGEVHLRVLNA